MTHVIVCGGRDFDDKKLLTESLDKILAEYSDIEIVSGRARGADTLGEEYAAEHNLPCATFPAKWNQFGKAAGYIRNAPVVVAFWNGESRGTKHMIDIATAKKAQVHIVRY